MHPQSLYEVGQQWIFVAQTNIPGGLAHHHLWGPTKPPSPLSHGRKARIGSPIRSGWEYLPQPSMCRSGVPVMGLAALQRALGAAMSRSTQFVIETEDWATRKRTKGGGQCAETGGFLS